MKVNINFTPLPKKTNHSVTVSSDQIFQDLIQWDVNKRTEFIGQVRNYLHPENIFFFQMDRKKPMLHSVPSNVIDLIIEIK